MICNDFSVADAINRETGRSNVIFVGTTRKDKSKRVVGLNWHGRTRSCYTSTSISRPCRTPRPRR